MRLVLASHNAKKLAELRALFGALPIALAPSSALGIGEPEEPHATFLENALVKARHAARMSGAAALADDSGLCVDSLGGAPGVHSATFAGAVELRPEREATRRLQDAANNALLLERMAGASDRRAAFVSTLVAIRSADDPEPLVAVGRWPGVILEAPRGAGGFGYDPLMWIESESATVAELDAARKNAISHRARAAARLLELMREAWHLA